MFKLLSDYALPHAFNIFVNNQHYTGYPLDPTNGPPTAVLSNLNLDQVSSLENIVARCGCPMSTW
jgi:hypothetical protein